MSNLPAFSSEHPLLFKTIGRIETLKNENGIVLVRTLDKQSLNFNTIKIADGASFNLSEFDNGDFTIEVVSGFQNVVKSVVFTLNSILIDFSAGNFIIDYDHDHTLKTVIPATLFSS